MTDFQTLNYEKKGNIGLLQLNRPKSLNAINKKMLDELEAFLEDRHRDQGTRVLILHGAGEKGFCSGVDEGCSYFLPRMIGAGRSNEFLLTGDPIDARTAKELGLVSRVVSKEKLMDTALEFAEKIAKHDTVQLRLTKEAINANLDAPGLESALMIEDRNQVLCALNNIINGKK